MLAEMMATGSGSAVFVELGAAIVGLAILARIANRLGFSAVPLYLVAGLAFGKGGLRPFLLARSSFTSAERLACSSCCPCWAWSTAEKS